MQDTRGLRTSSADNDTSSATVLGESDPSDEGGIGMKNKGIKLFSMLLVLVMAFAVFSVVDDSEEEEAAELPEYIDLDSITYTDLPAGDSAKGYRIQTGTTSEFSGITLNKPLLIVSGGILTITADTTFTAAAGAEVENHGSIMNNGSIIISVSGNHFINSGTITNNGTITVFGEMSTEFTTWSADGDPSAVIDNYGTITVKKGKMNIGSKDILNNLITHKLEIIEDGYLSSNGTINNYGEIVDEATLEVRDCSFYNYAGGILNNYGSFEEKADMDNYRGIINNGDSESIGTIIISGVDSMLFFSEGSITNASGSSITIKDDATLRSFNGKVVNHGNIISEGLLSSTYGEITPGDGGRSVRSLRDTGSTAESILVENDGQIEIGETGTLGIDVNTVLKNSGTITNAGTIGINDNGSLNNLGILIHEINEHSSIQGNIDNTGDIKLIIPAEYSTYNGTNTYEILISTGINGSKITPEYVVCDEEGNVGNYTYNADPTSSDQYSITLNESGKIVDDEGLEYIIVSAGIFSIIPFDLDSASIDGVVNFTYTGETQKQDAAISSGGVTLSINDYLDYLDVIDYEAKDRNDTDGYCITIYPKDGSTNFTGEFLDTEFWNIDSVSISQVSFTVTSESVYYTGQEHELPECSILLNGVDVSYNFDIDCSDSLVTAGTKTITLESKDGYTNFSGGQSPTASWTIEKASLSVTADDISLTYGDEVPTTDTVSYSGFVNGETEAALGGNLGFTTTYTSTSDAGGSYTITPIGLTSNNYEIEFVPGTVTVAKADLPEFAVSMDGFTYGQNASDPSVYGLVGDGAVTYAYKAEGSDTFGADKVVVAGTHTVKASVAEGTNYKSGEATSTYTVAKAELTIVVSMEGFGIGGEPTEPSVTGNSGNGQVTYSYQAHGTGDFVSEVVTEAGTHTVKAIVAETENYLSGEATSTYTVAFSASNIEVLFAEGTSNVYDGVEKDVNVVGGGIDFDQDYLEIVFFKNGEETEFINAGVYDVKITIKEDAPVDFTFDNGRSVTIESAIEIQKADYDMSGISFRNATKEYNRLPQHIEISGTLPTGADGIQVTVSYSGSAITARDGPRTITAVFATESENYNVPAPMTAVLTISEPANPPAPIDYDSGSGKTTEKSNDDDDGVSDAVIACIAAVAAAAAVIVAIVFFRQQ